MDRFSVGPATEGCRAMLVLDSFSAHITPAVKQKLKNINTVPVVIPGGGVHKQSTAIGC